LGRPAPLLASRRGPHSIHIGPEGGISRLRGRSPISEQDFPLSTWNIALHAWLRHSILNALRGSFGGCRLPDTPLLYSEVSRPPKKDSDDPYSLKEFESPPKNSYVWRGPHFKAHHATLATGGQGLVFVCSTAVPEAQVKMTRFIHLARAGGTDSRTPGSPPIGPRLPSCWHRY
jgi:hypothetical protein